MANVCQQPLEKRLRTKFLRQSDFKVEHMPADDLQSRRRVEHLHTISRIGRAPASNAEVKALVEDFFNRTGKAPSHIDTPLYIVNRGVGLIIPKIGYLFLKYRYNKKISQTSVS